MGEAEYVTFGTHIRLFLFILNISYVSGCF